MTLWHQTCTNNLVSRSLFLVSFVLLQTKFICISSSISFFLLRFQSSDWSILILSRGRFEKPMELSYLFLLYRNFLLSIWFCFMNKYLVQILSSFPQMDPKSFTVQSERDVHPCSVCECVYTCHTPSSGKESDMSLTWDIDVGRQSQKSNLNKASEAMTEKEGWIQRSTARSTAWQQKRSEEKNRMLVDRPVDRPEIEDQVPVAWSTGQKQAQDQRAKSQSRSTAHVEET